jgi:hypothetical protein
MLVEFCDIFKCNLLSSRNWKSFLTAEVSCVFCGCVVSCGRPTSDEVVVKLCVHVIAVHSYICRT